MTISDPPFPGEWVIPLVDNPSEMKYKVVGLYMRDEPIVRLDMRYTHNPPYYARGEYDDDKWADWLLSQVKRA